MRQMGVGEGRVLEESDSSEARAGEASGSGEASKSGEVTCAFAERFASPHRFHEVFQRTMALIDATTDYLDGSGWRESRMLGSKVSLAYATESMRLTTRLMALSSWLLVTERKQSGEITADHAERLYAKIDLGLISRPSHNPQFEQLPARLKSLVRQSIVLHELIVAMDRVMRPPEREGARPPANAVAEQQARIAAAFAPAPLG